MTSRPLALPLEVLERILELAFLPFVSSSSSSNDETTEPTPPSSTSHLLLVSKAIRQICLPFFWRSITIAKPSNWISLFDPKEGLVVVGEEGRKRWELIEEVRIVVEAVLPVSMGPRSDDTYRAQVHLPTYRRVPKLTFEPLPPSSKSNPPSWIAKEEERQSLRLRLFLLEQDVQHWNRPRTAHRTLADGSRDLYVVAETSEERARRVLQDVEAEFYIDVQVDRRVFQHTVLDSFQPLHAVIASHHWYEIDLVTLVPDAFDPLDFVCRLEFTKDPSSADRDDLYLISSANDVIQVEGGFTGTLVGFSREFLGQLERWVVEKGRSDAKESRWDSRWTWKREDGSTFFIDFSECWS